MDLQANVAVHANRLLLTVKHALETHGDLNASLEDCPLSAFVKAFDGRILFANSAYVSTFSEGRTAVGQTTRQLLSSTFAELADLSDQLILGGASIATFTVPSQDGSVEVHVTKHSLQALEHPSLAILGVVQVAGPNVPGQTAIVSKQAALARTWQAFKGLDAFDRDCARLLAIHGKTIEVAKLLEASPRTIEKHRKAIFQALSVEDVMQLSRCLCRLQDAGFADLGL